MPNRSVRIIESIRRLNLSVNGNPRFHITFTDGSSAQTMSDAGFGYAVGNPDMREGCTVAIEWTRAGKIRSMRPAEPIDPTMAEHTDCALCASGVADAHHEEPASEPEE